MFKSLETLNLEFNSLLNLKECHITSSSIRLAIDSCHVCYVDNFQDCSLKANIIYLGHIRDIVKKRYANDKTIFNRECYYFINRFYNYVKTVIDQYCKVASNYKGNHLYGQFRRCGLDVDLAKRLGY